MEGNVSLRRKNRQTNEILTAAAAAVVDTDVEILTA